MTDELAVEQPCSVSPPNSFEMGTSGIVGYEHIHQVQCFSVAEQVELTWLLGFAECMMDTKRL